MGYRLFDKVLYKNNECFISGRRTTGYFKLIKLDGIRFKIIRTKEFLFNREKKGGK